MSYIAFWPHTENKAVASYRIRCKQLVQYLRDSGENADIFNSSVTPSILVLSKRYDKKSLSQALELRKKHKTKLILDICDNHFYSKTNEESWSQKTANLISTLNAVDLVVASTYALRDIISEHLEKPADIHVIGDSVEAPILKHDLSIALTHPKIQFDYIALKRNIDSSKCNLIWFGNHGSDNDEAGMLDLLRISDNLNALDKKLPIRLTVLSNNATKYKQIRKGFNFETNYIQWNIHTFSKVLMMHDIAVIPITINPFTRCKTNNRLATAFMHNLAVVADAIPSYEEFEDAVVLNDWNNGLYQLASNSGQRKKNIEKGLSIIESRWTLKAVTNKWKHAFDAVSSI